MGRALPFVRSFTSVAAGSAGVPALRFGVLSLIGTAIYAAGMSTLGYVVGSAWHRVSGDLSVAGYVDNPEDEGLKMPGGPLLGPMANLRAIVEEIRPDRLVVAMAERRQRLPVQDLLDLRFSGMRIEDAAALYESVFARICIREIRPSQLIFTGDLGPRRRSLWFQDIYSTVVGAIVFVVSLPIMLATAILVKVSSPGPVLFRQKRVGKDGRVFTLYKFRSMYEDAEARTGAVWATKDDPRITPIGRWLRLLRLDEVQVKIVEAKQRP